MLSTVSFSAVTWLANAAPSISVSTSALRSTSLSLCWPLEVMEDNISTSTYNCLAWKNHTTIFPWAQQQADTENEWLNNNFPLYEYFWILINSHYWEFYFNNFYTFSYFIQIAYRTLYLELPGKGTMCIVFASDVETNSVNVAAGINKVHSYLEMASYWSGRPFSCSLSKILMLLDIVSISSSCSSDSCWCPLCSCGWNRLFW